MRIRVTSVLPSLAKAVSASLILLASPAVCIAATATSEIVGVMKHTFTGGSPGQSTNFFSLTEAPTVGAFPGKALGKITGFSSSSVTVAGAGWTAGDLANAATPFLLRMASGAAEGTTWQITDNTADSLTLLMQTASLIDLGVMISDRFEIIPAETLLSLFGANTTLAGGTSPTIADVVWLFNGFGWAGYYFNTTEGHWAGVAGLASLNRDNIIIRPDSGVLVYRRTATAELTRIGRVANSALRVPVRGTTTAAFVGSFPRSGNLVEFQASVSPWWVSNSDPALADRVYFFNGFAFSGYYHDGTNWKRVGLGTIVDPVAIQLLQASRPILIQRSSASASTLFIHALAAN